MKPDPTMRHFHHWRGFAVIRRGHAWRFGSLCALIVAMVSVPVLVRTSHQLSTDVPVKPKPSLLRSCKGNERTIEKINQFETVFGAPGSIATEHGAEVCSRFSLDALLVGARLIAHSQALRAPPVDSL
ncbi:MAG TPA: hypothetical protein VH701_27295 [Vicinamibacterales bacterium]